MITRISRAVLATVITATLLGFAGTAYGVDGVVLIDQNRALAGNVTPGDAPGFPVSINQPGSYRLSGNLTVPNENTTAIEISASDVTIDLNGFSVRGPTVCTLFGGRVSSCAPVGSGRGISTLGVQSSITVHNGTVRGMGSFGIALGGNGHLVEKVRAESNNSTGISIFGTAIHNTATRNGGEGISVGQGTASHNTAVGNRAPGLAVGVGIANHNTAVSNGFGLALGPDAGYIANVMSSNDFGSAFGGVSLGGGNHNLCNGVPC